MHISCDYTEKAIGVKCPAEEEAVTFVWTEFIHGIASTQTLFKHCLDWICLYVIIIVEYCLPIINMTQKNATDKIATFNAFVIFQRAALTFARNRRFLLVLLLLLHSNYPKLHAGGPHIAMHNGRRYLSVNNKPYIVMSVQDHKTLNHDGTPNEHYFNIASQLCANTVSVTLRWYAFEEKENKYETAILRKIKSMAEKYGLKVIILWFGSNISGHENCVPDYVRKNPTRYLRYMRRDGSIATMIDSTGDAGIYCYSFDDRNPNYLLQREQKALAKLLSWIRDNDSQETFIMLQLGNELFVNPDLWRPWPPLQIHPTNILPGDMDYSWSENFHVQGCSLSIETDISSPPGFQLEISLTDTKGKRLWNSARVFGGRQKLRLGGHFVNRKCRLKVAKYRVTNDTIRIENIVIKPIAERCHCYRCNKIYRNRKFTRDQDYAQFVFLNYLKELSNRVAEANPEFPLYLNLYIADDAKTLLGNPFYDPSAYLDSISSIDIMAPDIYLRSSVDKIQSFDFGRNLIFIPEAGTSKDQLDLTSAHPYALIFPVVGEYSGIGLQLYDMISPDFGLITTDNQWEPSAYLARNSFCTIGRLPATLFTTNRPPSIIGFSQVSKRTYRLGDMDLVIKATGVPEHARGVIVQTDTTLVVAGIGFEAEIRIAGSRYIRSIEQGYWKDNRFSSLGRPKNDTHSRRENTISIRMDDDDLSPAQDYIHHGNQYCVKIDLL